MTRLRAVTMTILALCMVGLCAWATTLPGADAFTNWLLALAMLLAGWAAAWVWL